MTAMDGTRHGPLAGIRIVEFDAIGPVPLAAMILADLGCDVVRIVRGDGQNMMGGAVLQRGRSHLPLDLKDPADRDRALDLVARADGLIEGLRPGVMERLGLGPDACLARNPRLVYGRMTGWGQTGPLAQRAGHDINYIAITGALHAMGSRGAPPAPPLNLVGDYGGGSMFLLTGMLAALLSAKATGQGQVVDAAMTDGTAMLTSMFHAFLAEGTWRDEREANLLDGHAPFYRCYTCADGKFISVGALEAQFFALLLAGLGIPADRFAQHDRSRWAEMGELFATTFASRTRDEWAAVFADTDACVAPVLSFAEALDDPHNAARGTFVTDRGVAQPAPAPRFSRTPAAIDHSVEGEADIVAVLARWA
jgi:alpha-methylacyl-CoA racemase